MLFVDDEPASIQLFQAQFEQWEKHIEVLTAGNGRKALEVLGQRRPDLVITNLHMPVMDGLDLARMIHQITEGGKIPIIITSGAPYANMEKLLRDYGCQLCLQLPVSYEKLLVVIRQFVDFPEKP